jgi:hypothetical protein
MIEVAGVGLAVLTSAIRSNHNCCPLASEKFGRSICDIKLLVA